MKRTGLFGGRFDPPHAGHLKLAGLAWDHLALDELRFVPTAGSPHKVVAGAPAEARCHMLQALLDQGDHPCAIERIEVDKGGISYTVDTLECLTLREPDHAWILIMGADQLAALPSWKDHERVLAMAAIACAPRPGFELQIPEVLRERLCPHWSGAPGEIVLLPSTGMALSSESVRAELAAGALPPSLGPQVLAVIERERLYRLPYEEHE